MFPWLAGKEVRVHEKDFIHGWELCGKDAICKSNWKADFIPKLKGPGKWQLYDLSPDRVETHDLAETNERSLKNS